MKTEEDWCYVVDLADKWLPRQLVREQGFILYKQFMELILASLETQPSSSTELFLPEVCYCPRSRLQTCGRLPLQLRVPLLLYSCCLSQEWPLSVPPRSEKEH